MKFDLPKLRGADLRDRLLSERRAALEQLLAGAAATSAPALGLQTRDVGQARE